MVKTTEENVPIPTFDNGNVVDDDHTPAHKDFRVKYFAGFKTADDAQPS